MCACASSVVGAVWQRVRPAQNRAARECGRTGSPRSAHSSWPYPRTCAVSARAQRHHASRHSMPVRPFRLRWRQQKGSAASCAAPRAPSSLRTRHPGVESPDALRGDSVDACVSNRPPMHDLVHRCASAGRESLPARDSGEDNRDGCSAGCHAERCAGAKAAAATVSSARVAARDFIGHCDRSTPDAKPSADCTHATRRTVAVHRTEHQVTQVSSKTEFSSRTQRRVATAMALAWVWAAGGRAQRMSQPGDRERAIEPARTLRDDGYTHSFLHPRAGSTHPQKAASAIQPGGAPVKRS